MEKEEKLYDFDAAFDRRIGEYMQKKKGKFTAEQWEDALPRLYRQFSTTKIEAIGCSPEEYYDRMTAEEISQAVRSRLDQSVGIDGFLRTALEKETNRPVLFSLLQEGEPYCEVAIGILREEKEAFPDYLQLLKKGVSERTQGEILSFFFPHADEYADELLALAKEPALRECAAEILSHVNVPREEIFSLLTESFLSAENPGAAAERLAMYGDDRALPYLQERAAELLSYPDWRSVKYAAESLGGSVPDRDFSADKDYLKLKEEEDRLAAEREKGLSDRK